MFSFVLLSSYVALTWVAILASLLAAGLLAALLRYRRQIRNERILTYFATSLYGRNTEEDIFWDIAKNCISQLGFEDCVIYGFDPTKQVLIQKAAYGPKNPVRRVIINAIEIPLGTGITGSVALKQQAEIVGDTRQDPRYVLDDEQRSSEIAVPILYRQELIGVIDSEHSKPNFFTAQHLNMLTRIAKICAQKVHAYQVEQRLRDKIARDLHDELGSSLTSINIMSQVAQRNQTPEKVLHYLQRIGQHSKEIMENMSDIVWSINPHNDNLDKLALRMRELLNELLEPAGLTYRFESNGNLVQTYLDPNQRKDLYLIFKEAITNILKHSGATEVQVQLNSIKNFCQLIITDNGRGVDLSNVSEFSGNGLRNMQTRAASIGATCTLASLPNGSGLAVSIDIPITPSGDMLC